MDLTEIRQDINVVDREIVALLEKRMSLVDQVAAYKQQTGKAIFDPEREQELLTTVANTVANKDYEETIVATFADIMKQSRTYQASKVTSK